MNELASTRIGRLILTASVVLGLALVWKSWPHRQPPDLPTDIAPLDPRLTFSTPYGNLRPDVTYVGDQVCAQCHLAQSESYRDHPMGRALAPVAEATAIERFEPTVFNPFRSFGLKYDVRRAGQRVLHRESLPDAQGKQVAELETEVAFAMGSGARVRGYVINHDGYLFESPISWFSREQRWDLSPSYELRNQHFGRPITPGCVFCHANRAEPVPGTVNHYREPIFLGYAIGCERCHGPGELHVRERERGDAVEGVDYSIVNPAWLEHSLREAVCQQCHVQGEQRIVARGRADFDYRPGLPLPLFLMDFVNGKERGADAKFVNSVEQMVTSRCYQASREPKKLGCISCHDPHRQPTVAERIAFYRQRCLQCHTEQSCSLPLTVRHEKTKQDSCIACHMPRGSSEVNHTSITNHRVPRRSEESLAMAAGRPPPGPDDLVPFHRGLVALPESEVSRNLGLALMAMLEPGMRDAVARPFARKALLLLEGALQRDPEDGPAVEARGDALWCLGRRNEALAAYEAVLAARPEAETALQGAGNLALAMDRPELAQAYFERVVRVNPWRGQYHQGLAVASFRRGDWDRAVRECQASLRLEPSSSASRSLLVQCYLALDVPDKARAEFETLVQLTPEERRQDLRRWLVEQQRRLSPRDRLQLP